MMNIKQHKHKNKNVSQGFLGKRKLSQMNIFATLNPKNNMQPEYEHF